MRSPFMQLWVADFLADTMELDAREIGAYMLILMTMWSRDGYLPSDTKKLQRVARVGREWPKVWAALEGYFQTDGDRIWNRRLLEEAQKCAAKREVNSHAGSLGGKAKALKYREVALANATKTPKQPESESEDRDKSLSPRASRFDEFWAVYPHRGGVKRNRKGAAQKFALAVKRGVPEQTLIDGAKRYATDRRVVDGYARDPTTWLNQEGWTDEVEPSPAAGGYDPQVDRWNYIAKHGSSEGWRRSA